MCEYCEPWYDPKPLVETPGLVVRLRVKDDMNRYVQVSSKGLWTGKWREVYLEPIGKCPICGEEV